jgi:hypothetical protein
MTPLFLLSLLAVALAVAAAPFTLLAMKGIAYIRDPVDPENPLRMESSRSIEQLFIAGWDNPLYKPQLEDLVRTKLRRRPLAEVSTSTRLWYIGLTLGLGLAVGLITGFTAEVPPEAPLWLFGVLAGLTVVVAIGVVMDLTSAILRYRAAHALTRRFERASPGPSASPRASIEDMALKAVAFSAGALVFRLAVVVADAAAVVSLFAM